MILRLFLFSTLLYLLAVVVVAAAVVVVVVVVGVVFRTGSLLLVFNFLLFIFLILPLRRRGVVGAVGVVGFVGFVGVVGVIFVGVTFVFSICSTSIVDFIISTTSTIGVAFVSLVLSFVFTLGCVVDDDNAFDDFGDFEDFEDEEEEEEDDDEEPEEKAVLPM